MASFPQPGAPLAAVFGCLLIVSLKPEHSVLTTKTEKRVDRPPSDVLTADAAKALVSTLVGSGKGRERKLLIS
jgi:hypothetical protein